MDERRGGTRVIGDQRGGALSPDSVLIFIHIPKTAGTAFRLALGRLYPKAERAYLYDEPLWPEAVHPAQLGDESILRRRRLRFVMGHVVFGVHRVIPHEPAYVAMVREPVDRIISLYHHQWKLANTASETVESYVFTQRSVAADNGMVRMIAGVPHVPFGRVTQQMYEVAMEHVEVRFRALLVYERMSESTAQLSDLLGRPIPRLRRINVTERLEDGPAPESVRSRILELNRYDAMLHQYAVDALGA